MDEKKEVEDKNVPAREFSQQKDEDSKSSGQPIDSKRVKENGEESINSAQESPEVDREEKKNKKKGELERLLEEKEEELREKHDQLLRALAEYENYKKRMIREKANLLKFGNESLIKELLPVIDSLELSLEHARNTRNIDSIVEGIEMIKKEFLKKLEKFGLKAISAKGERFDPTKHEATSQVETSEYPENTIVEELQKGYLIHDRLLRPAMVTVAKAPQTSPSEPSKSKDQ
jgi:molecular chaperone GrpE